MKMGKIVNIVVLISFINWELAVAAPVGGDVIAGQASISQQGSVTQITQNTQNAVINWQSFNTNSSEHVNFTQPNAQSIALNRITNGLPTQFQGILTANGQVWIVNPAGVFFSNTSKIDAAGILATTLDIKNSDFMNGQYHFTSQPGFMNTSVINEGEINTIRDNGLVALMAPGVENHGIIRANAGKVVLASGTDMTLDFYGDNLITFAAGSQVSETPIGPDGKPLNNAVSNTGIIEANNGGQVLLTANAAAKVVQNVVSMTGVIEAENAVQTNSGVIILGGSEGVTHVGGKIYSNRVKIKGHQTKIDAQINAPENSFVETSGDFLDLTGVDLRLGSGSTWLIDPWNIEVVSGSSVNNSGPTAFTPTGASSQIDVSLINAQLAAGNTVMLNASLGSGADPGQVGNITISAPISSFDGLVYGTGSLHLLPATGSGGQIYLNTNSITLSPTGSQIFFEGPTVLNQDVTINALRLNFNGTIDSDSSLTPRSLNISADTVDFEENIGQTNPLNNLDLSMYGTNGVLFNLSGPVLSAMSVTTIGNQTYSTSGLTYLYVNATDTTFTGDTLTFGMELNANFSNQNIVLDGNNVVINSPVGAHGTPQDVSFGNGTLGSLVTLNGGTIETIGTQTYDSDVMLSSNTSLTGTDITFNKKIDGTNDLTVTGNAVFNGNVGHTINLNNLTVTGQTILNNFFVTTVGDQDYQGPVSVTLNSDHLGANSVTFGDTLDGPGGLIIDVAGNTTFNNTVGLTSPLAGLRINGGTIINTSSINSTGTLRFVGGVTLGTDTNLTGSLVRFQDTLDGPYNLVITGNGQFDAQVGSGTPLASLTVNGSNTTINTDFIHVAGIQEYTGNVLMDNSTLDLAGSDVIFGGNITTVGIGTPALTINATNSIVFDGNIGTSVKGLGDINLTTSGGTIDFNNALTLYANSLTTNGSTSDNLNVSSINTVADQTYNDPVVLENGTVNMTGANVIFNNTVNGASDLSITGDVDFEQNVGNLINLNSILVSGQTIIRSTAINTTGQQTYNGPVFLFNGLFPTNLTASLATFGSTIDGPNDFTVTGNAQFNGDIGMSTFLFNFSVLGDATFNAGNLRTMGGHFFQGPVTLNTPLNIIGISFGAQTVFNSTVQGAGQNLTVDTGSLYFFGNVGSSGAPLGNLDLTAVGQIDFASPVFANSITTHGLASVFLGADIQTSGDQTYNNFVQVVTSLVNLSGANVIFNNSLESLDGTQGLDITSAVSTQFNGDVGSLNPLGSIGLNTPAIISGNVSTTGAQNYSGGVTLTNNAQLSASDVSIQNGISGGAFNLDIQATNTDISGPMSLNSLTVTGTGGSNSFEMNTGSIQTWNIVGTDAGSITGIGGFNNIQTITGGLADTFVFANGAKMTGAVNGGGINSTLDLSAFIPANPVSVTMTDVASGSGVAYSALIGDQIDPSSPITAFNFMGRVVGNGHGFFTVAAAKQPNIVILSVLSTVSPTQQVVNGFVTDPIFFDNFIITTGSPSLDLTNISTIQEGFVSEVSTSSDCLGESCESSDIIVISDAASSESKPVAHVSCMMGFATAVDGMGVERIVLPGDEIYADEKIAKSDGGCVKVHYNKDYEGSIPGTSQFCPGEKSA